MGRDKSYRLSRTTLADNIFAQAIFCRFSLGWRRLMAGLTGHLVDTPIKTISTRGVCRVDCVVAEDGRREACPCNLL